LLIPPKNEKRGIWGDERGEFRANTESTLYNLFLLAGIVGGNELVAAFEATHGE